MVKMHRSHRHKSGLIVGVSFGGSSLSDTAALLGFSHTKNDEINKKTSNQLQFWRQKHLVNERGCRIMARLITANRKDTSEKNHSCVQEGMSKCATCQLEMVVETKGYLSTT